MWGIIGNVMLCFATNMISILYTTISFIFTKSRGNKANAKIEPEMTEENIKNKNCLKDFSQAEISLPNYEEKFYSKLSRRKHIELRIQ